MFREIQYIYGTARFQLRNSSLEGVIVAKKSSAVY
jgi:hypothetical protein